MANQTTYRLNSLSPENQNKFFMLLGINPDAFPSREALLSSISSNPKLGPILDNFEQTGQIPQEVQGNQDIVKTLSALPSDRKGLLNNVIGKYQPADEGTLTDSELQDRLNAYKELGTLPGDQQTTFRGNDLASAIAAEAKKGFKDRNIGGVSDVALKVASQWAANALRDGVPTAQFTQTFSELLNDNSGGKIDKTGFEKLKQTANGLPGIFGPQVSSYYGQTVGPSLDTSPDVKRISDLMGANAANAKGQQDVQNAVGSLQDELARGRGAFLDQQAGQGVDYFQHFLAPEVEQGLNAKGLYNSGDLTSELTRTAGGVASTLQDQAAQLQQEDDLFFQNAGYQAAFQAEVKAGRDVSGQLASDRQQTSQNQQSSFQKSQAQIANTFSQDLYQRQQDRALQAQRRQQQDAQRQADSQNQANLYGQIANSVAQIGGTYAGNKLSQKQVNSPNGVANSG